MILPAVAGAHAVSSLLTHSRLFFSDHDVVLLVEVGLPISRIFRFSVCSVHAVSLWVSGFKRIVRELPVPTKKIPPSTKYLLLPPPTRVF